ncbi:FAD-binding protein [Azospirillum sp. TSA6c]|uniref:FAD-dependent oxidoreductase n=1 Tax=unclassified Azospirillum TaxID=2630922 RepID=UPI000D6073D4|nr:FAD-binding protein [Azospirillum sp. TSA6c]PWC47951.1 oxidoreductase [Azospirillum sp. TSA6c]
MPNIRVSTAPPASGLPTAELPPIAADVLVIGGGLSGTWAALAAAQAGARVVLADKGYCGASGVAATSGPGHWWVPPDADARAEAIRQRMAIAGGIADPAWMERILDITWTTLPTIADVYDFSTDETGTVQYRGLRGPEYLRAMRRKIHRLGVRILDQSPALELLADTDGTIVGARGLRRQRGEAWTVRAAAVILATGGCAFKSRLLGSHTNTGDGHLMAAEAGVDFSGMEFSTYHTVAPANSTMTRSMSFAFASYYDGEGREIAVPPGDTTRTLARAMLEGPVLCSLHRMPADIRERLRRVQPNMMLPFDRGGAGGGAGGGLDPFTQRFPVLLRPEGTIRGSGGIRLADDDCGTAADGLFVVGDAATREPVAGAVSGGGAILAAWALSSGVIAGRAAAARAARPGRRTDSPARPLGQAGLRPARHAAAVDPRAVTAAVQAEMLPYDKTIFRRGPALARSLSLLDGVWRDLRDHLHGEGAATAGETVQARESAALTAVARWCTRAALDRAESRGMHLRVDAPAGDPALARRLIVGGLDRLRSRFDGPSPQPLEHPATTQAGAA